MPSTTHPSYLVVDLEATCWDDPVMRERQREESEIIEIGAVLLDDALTIIDKFQTFVHPNRHPNLSEFCQKLTSIRQTDVDSAPTFPEAMDLLVNGFLKGSRAILCSWGYYDRNQIKLECQRHAVHYPFGTGHINIKVNFSQWSKERGGPDKSHGVSQALKKIGMTFQGTPHRGIDDAINIVRIFQTITKP